MTWKAAVLGSFTLVLCACGTEVGRAPFASQGATTTQATLKAGEVALWTDIDVEYEGDADMSYAVTLEQGGKEVAKTTCNPLERLSTRVSWVETNIGSKHSRRGMGKLACTATVPAAGPTTAKVTLTVAAKGPFALKKADLVLKQ